MKKLLIILMVVFAFGCTTTTFDEPVKEVKFNANYFGVEQGSLKSFNINEWEHFHWMYRVDVSLVNVQSGIEYKSTATNARIFFEDGTDPIYLPYGEYNCSVAGGGWPTGADAYSASYYIWSIADTLINITSDTGIITFNLDKRPALLVKDADVPITYWGIRSINDSLQWTSRGEYDFAYVTPYWNYASIYGGDTIIIETEPDSYYYFITAGQKSATVDIPNWNGNEIEF